MTIPLFTMSLGEDLKSFVKRLLTIAAEDILVAFQQKINEYEEKIDSQHRLLEKLRPDTTILPPDFPQQHAYKDKWVLTDHHWNYGLASDPPQIKEHLSSTPKKEQTVIENNEMLLSINQDRDPSEHPTLDLNLDDSLQKTLAIMSVINSEESEPNLQPFSHSTHEDNNHKEVQQNDSTSTLPEKSKQNHPQHKDFQGQHFVMCKEEDGEVLINLGQWNTERNSGLDPEDTKPQHVKEEHLRITAEEVVLKQETDASLFPTSSEVYSKDQTLNPDNTTKLSLTKLPLLNPVMSEPNSDPLLLLSTICREDKVIGQRKTRRVGSRSTRQDKNITQSRQRAGKRDAKDVQKPSKLKRDRNSDKGEKSFKCDTCGKRFNFKSTLHIHIRIHTGEKPYVCKTCGKSFTQQGHLSSHILIHTGEKPYVCLTCKKGFLRKKMLHDHMIIHTGLHPHVCVTCEKGFILKKDLTAHIRTHKAEKQHVCQTCGSAYTLKSTLRSHMRVHKSK